MAGQENSEGSYREDKFWCHTQFKEYKGTLTWKIADFSQIKFDAGEFFTSPEFGLVGEDQNSWNLRLYPNGKTVEQKDLVAVFLHSKTGKKIADPVTCEIAIVDLSGEMAEKKKLVYYSNESAGWEDFVSRSSLSDLKDLLLPDDVLTVYCELATVKKLEKTWKSGPNRPRSFGCDVRREKTFSYDFGQLLQKDDEFSDVVFHVGDAKIPAHKVVLMARSSVFATMFQQDMREAQTNTVIIKDIEVEVFREIISYMYTNECDLPNVQFAVQLLAAADLYDIPSLKTMCSDYMKDNLSAKNAFKVVACASTFGECKLRKNCVDIICSELPNLAVSGADWKKILPSDPEVLEDILQLFAENEKTPGNFSVVATSNCSVESKACFGQSETASRTVSLLWKISGFSLCRYLENSKCFFSPDIWFGDDKMKFYLELYPNGETCNEKGFISMCFVAKNRENVIIKHSCCIKNTNKAKTVAKIWKNHSTNFAKYSFFREPKLIATKDLLDDKSVLPNDELVVFLKIDVSRLSTESPTQSTFVAPKVNSLTEDFRRMFDKQAFTDIVLQLKETQVPAHKLILSTRSSLLANSGLDFTEAKEHVLKELIRYLYTDTCSLKNSTEALAMLEAAHKYDVPSLQAKCCDYLHRHLSDENVFDVVVPVFSLPEKELYENCLEYIRQELPPVSFLPWRMRKLRLQPDIVKDIIGRYVV